MSSRATCIDADILTPDGFIRGTISFTGGRIESIEGKAISETAMRDSAQRIVLPGFIDTHVHGGAGVDVMDGGDSIEAIAGLHLQHGTTALLATTMTAPYDDLAHAFKAVAHAIARPYSSPVPPAARILGVHLEGPYINPGKLGAQPDYARALSLPELTALHAFTPIRLITLAPEMPGNLEAITALRAHGFIVQIGHSAATYEETCAALERGASGFTHLFNAMTGLHHRKPGVAGAALAHAQFAEIIPDLLHVHPGAIHTALRCIPKLFCVTDSTAAAGMPDGEYRLGRQTVHKCMGGVRLADGTLAGSTLTMDQAFRNLVNALALSLSEASARVSTYAADYLGLTDRGRLQIGAMADLVVLDRDLALTDVFAEGRPRA
jgi:N-acetylglucosamine-6-phosphate deacetylase